MADICSDVSKLASDIRDMLREQSKTKLNQTAALNGKITDIKAKAGEYREMTEGKAVIYTGDPRVPSLEPEPRDVEEIIEQKRPFICRATRMVGKDEMACYSPKNELFDFIKEDIKSINEAEKGLTNVISERWGTPQPQTSLEEALIDEIESRRRILRRLLKTEPAETIRSSYTGLEETVVPERPGLATKVLKRCTCTLR